MLYVDNDIFDRMEDAHNNAALVRKAELQFKDKCRSGRYASLNLETKIRIFAAFKRFKDNALKQSPIYFQ